MGVFVLRGFYGLFWVFGLFYGFNCCLLFCIRVCVWYLLNAATACWIALVDYAWVICELCRVGSCLHVFGLALTACFVG